ncbi:hypothetical protein D9757_005877 [Collybiopsis confluens]|uniref:DUF6535 domain-containing protein n=1 Tax=Collybiopsis confluens TaxID=2823264 RepID=A0A8H5MAA3_9AGAR|nr:hypothetical protein D9757_005877 [Collybiopsis confluens]
MDTGKDGHVKFFPEESFTSFRDPAFSHREPSFKSANEAPLSSRLWMAGDQYRYAGSPNTGDHWERMMKRISVFDEEMCKGWREDVDTLLVFAGLFSAAVTAFLIESYRWLQQSPENSTNLLLLQLLQQLQNNGTGVVLPENSLPSDSVSPLSIRVNVFWFSSLALSLSCAIIGILCKQWLREYQRDAALSPRDALMLRQTRLESFEKWKVVDILSALPLLLQSALVLFFAGIVDLLWSLNTIVAVVLTCEIGIALLLVSMTTVFPTLALLLNAKLPCAYKSPQAWIFYRLVHSIARYVERFLLRMSRNKPTMTSRLKTMSRIKNWTAGDRLSVRFSDNAAAAVDENSPNDCLGAAMRWVYSEYRDNVSMTPYIFYCLEELDEETLAVATNQANLKSRYYLYCDLIKNLPVSRERQKFACELLLRDINGTATSQAQRSLYISHLMAELRFGPAVDTDEEFLLQIIHTARNFVQSSVDGPSPSYRTILDVSYLFLYCWREGSDEARRYSLLVLDDIERCIQRLSDHISRATFGFDFVWLMYRAAEVGVGEGTGKNGKGKGSGERLLTSQFFYDPLICSERFLRFVRFLDGFHDVNHDHAMAMDGSDGGSGSGVLDPAVEAWKQQKASLAIQGGLPASYFDSKSSTSSIGSQ